MRLSISLDAHVSLSYSYGLFEPLLQQAFVGLVVDSSFGERLWGVTFITPKPVEDQFTSTEDIFFQLCMKYRGSEIGSIIKHHLNNLEKADHDPFKARHAFFLEDNWTNLLFPTCVILKMQFPSS